MQYSLIITSRVTQTFACRAHAIELNNDPDEPPFFFLKPRSYPSPPLCRISSKPFQRPFLETWLY